MKFILVSILSVLSTTSFAKPSMLNRTLLCTSVADVSSEIIRGKEKLIAMARCRMDESDGNSGEDMTFEVTSTQAAMLTALYTSNRPFFKGDPLFPYMKFAQKKGGPVFLKKINLAYQGLSEEEEDSTESDQSEN